ncbi:Plug domain-containing protein [Sphingomonas aerolata]|uniref:Plug domain-containing protein n=1 Tax=Sphingomonas aerolata TaxID=185951 RepID=UPI002FDF89FA
MTIISTRLALAALAASCSTGALAQAIVAPDPATGPAARASVTNGDDIVVTAQKREQRIEDVPLTVTALTGAKMADIGVNSLSEVAAYIPGLQIQEQSANNPGFVIRGITLGQWLVAAGARVTLYHNGVDISRSRGAYQDLYDLERIEAGKGPRGDAVRQPLPRSVRSTSSPPSRSPAPQVRSPAPWQLQQDAGVGLYQRRQRRAVGTARLRL